APAPALPIWQRAGLFRADSDCEDLTQDQFHKGVARPVGSGSGFRHRPCKLILNKTRSDPVSGRGAARPGAVGGPLSNPASWTLRSEPGATPEKENHRGRRREDYRY